MKRRNQVERANRDLDSAKWRRGFDAGWKLACMEAEREIAGLCDPMGRGICTTSQEEADAIGKQNRRELEVRDRAKREAIQEVRQIDDGNRALGRSRAQGKSCGCGRRRSRAVRRWVDALSGPGVPQAYPPLTDRSAQHCPLHPSRRTRRVNGRLRKRA